MRDPLCIEAMRTNRELRLRIQQLERVDAGWTLRQHNRALRERDEALKERDAAVKERDAAQAEVDAARIYLWQRLPWKGYAS